MTYIPRHNAPLEHKEWVEWVQKELLALRRENERLAQGQATSGRQAAVGASHTSTINVQSSENTADIDDLKGRAIPDGGWRGSPIIRDVNDALKWTSPVGSIVPMYWVYLQPGAPWFDVIGVGSHTTSEMAKSVLPAPLFEDDGRSLDWPISWGDEFEDLTSGELASNNLPISMAVYLSPTEAGQDFRVVLPIAVRGAPWSVIQVYNDGDVTADVTLWFQNSTPLYAGTGVAVPTVRSLAPGEGLAWKLDEAHEQGVVMVTPFTAGQSATDSYYWANVAAVRMSKEFSAFGDNVEPVVSAPIKHGRLDSPRIGKVRAAVSPAPTTGGLAVDVKLNGVSILSTPLVVGAGSTSAEVVPDVTNYSNPYFGSAAVWGPSAELTFEIVSNDSTTPVTTLTGQVFYG